MELDRVADILISMQRDIVEEIRDSGVELGEVVGEGAADRTFQVDTVPEQVLEAALKELASKESFRLVNEERGEEVYGEEPEFTLITDVVDGSRLLGADLPGAYSLAAVAPSTGSPTLDEVVLAVQTEIPVGRHRSGEQFIWTNGGGLRSRVLSGTTEFSRVETDRGGIQDTATVSCVPPFRGAHPVTDEVRAAVEDAIDVEVVPDLRNSSGGQIANLGLGRYDVVSDLRPLEADAREDSLGIAAKPYDVCTYRGFEATGARFYSILEENGSYRLRQGIPAEMDVKTRVGWIGYASSTIEDRLHGPVEDVLSKRGVQV